MATLSPGHHGYPTSNFLPQAGLRWPGLGTPSHPLAPHQQRLGEVGQPGPQQSSQGAEEDGSQTQHQHGHWPLSNQLGIAGKEGGAHMSLRLHPEGVLDRAESTWNRAKLGSSLVTPRGPGKAQAYLFGIWKARSCLWKRRKDDRLPESSCRACFGGGGGVGVGG